VKIFTVQRKFITIATISFLVGMSGVIPIKLAIARYQTPEPQAILTLGGGSPREIFTAEFAKSHPYLPIWVSTGSKTIEAREIFQDAGVDNRRVYIDRRATDTVTNFTTLVNDFKKQNIRHIYLITDDYHLPRAKAIAFIVLGSQGITYTPIFLQTNKPAEPKFKIVRDLIRSLFWILTKHTGSSLNHRSIVK
jgi:uncharacterized SAM-binding protein YcdF (DUF218 family)